MRTRIQLSSMTVALIDIFKGILSKTFDCRISNGFVVNSAFESVSKEDITKISWEELQTEETEILNKYLPNIQLANKSLITTLDLTQQTIEKIVEAQIYIKNALSVNRCRKSTAIRLILVYAIKNNC